MGDRTRVFSRDELDRMGFLKTSSSTTGSNPYQATELHREEGDQWNTGSLNHLIFRTSDDGRTWRVPFLKGKDSYGEDLDPWCLCPEIEAVEVHLLRMEYTSWMTEYEASVCPHRVTSVKEEDV